MAENRPRIGLYVAILATLSGGSALSAGENPEPRRHPGGESEPELKSQRIEPRAPAQRSAALGRSPARESMAPR